MLFNLLLLCFCAAVQAKPSKVYLDNDKDQTDCKIICSVACTHDQSSVMRCDYFKQLHCSCLFDDTFSEPTDYTGMDKLDILNSVSKKVEEKPNDEDEPLNWPSYPNPVYGSTGRDDYVMPKSDVERFISFFLFVVIALIGFAIYACQAYCERRKSSRKAPTISNLQSNMILRQPNPMHVEDNGVEFIPHTDTKDEVRLIQNEPTKERGHFFGFII